MEILELKLQTNDLIGTKKFYNQNLGFNKVEESKKTISFCAGTSKLTFELTEDKITPKYHFAFNIPANKLNDAIKWLLQRTDIITTDNNNYITEFDNWNARSIYFFDNNQNILEFICRTEMNNSTKKNFSVDTILNINEIGIVTDNPIQLGENINEKANIEFYSRGPKREDFAAVGDDEGLFVISNSNRNWYPTKEKAEKNKVEAKIRVAESEFEFSFN